MKQEKYIPTVWVTLFINDDELVSRVAVKSLTLSFINRMNKKIKEFRDLIEDDIYNLQAENTKILFEQFGLGDKHLYRVYINADEEITALKIQSIIQKNIIDIDLEFRFSKIR